MQGEVHTYERKGNKNLKWRPQAAWISGSIKFEKMCWELRFLKDVLTNKMGTLVKFVVGGTINAPINRMPHYPPWIGLQLTLKLCLIPGEFG